MNHLILYVIASACIIGSTSALSRTYHYVKLINASPNTVCFVQSNNQKPTSETACKKLSNSTLLLSGASTQLKSKSAYAVFGPDTNISPTVYTSYCPYVPYATVNAQIQTCSYQYNQKCVTSILGKCVNMHKYWIITVK